MKRALIIFRRESCKNLVDFIGFGSGFSVDDFEILRDFVLLNKFK